MVQSTADFLQKLQHIYLKRNVFFVALWVVALCALCWVKYVLP